MFKEKIHDDIRIHAEQSVPNECCGFIIHNNISDTIEIFKCENIAQEKVANFVINPNQFLEAEKTGKILAYYHSHTLGDEQPSMADKINAQAVNLPSVIYSIFTKKFFFYIPDNFRAPLIGRPFVWGISDCFSLIYDYYKFELNILLNNNYLRTRLEDVVENNYFEKDINTQGFTKVESLQKNDVIGMKIDSKVMSHVAIYLGNEQILHHPGPGKLSRRSFYGSYWRKVTCGFYRHKNLMGV